jgi:hypothetical protein
LKDVDRIFGGRVDHVRSIKAVVADVGDIENRPFARLHRHDRVELAVDCKGLQVVIGAIQRGHLDLVPLKQGIVESHQVLMQAVQFRGAAIGTADH